MRSGTICPFTGRSRGSSGKGLEFLPQPSTGGRKPFAERKNITLLNCIAHARRGFEKALDYDKANAGYAMEMFQKLYAIERKAKEKNMSPEQRHTLRLDQALPVLNDLGKWIVETYKTVLPKSPTGKAIAYCIPRWDNLINYLFAGSARGAEWAAMSYSFFGTCKKNNVNPFNWLKKVLEVIPEHKVNKLHKLLPQNLEL